MATGDIVRIRSARIKDDIRGALSTGVVDRLELEWWLGAQQTQIACGLISADGAEGRWQRFDPGVVNHSEPLVLEMALSPRSASEVTWGRPDEILLLERSAHPWFRRITKRARLPQKLDLLPIRHRFLVRSPDLGQMVPDGGELLLPILDETPLDLVYWPRNDAFGQAEKVLCLEIGPTGARPISVADFGKPLPPGWRPMSPPPGRATIFGISQREALDRERESQAFDDALESLFGILSEEGIFGVNVDNWAGFSPGDHGATAADDEIPEWFLRAHHYGEAANVPICWTDTKYYRDEARITEEYEVSELLEAIWERVDCRSPALPLSNSQTSGCIYYTAASEDDALRIATRICAVAPAAGLVAEWEGTINRAVGVELAARDGAG